MVPVPPPPPPPPPPPLLLFIFIPSTTNDSLDTDSNVRENSILFVTVEETDRQI
jgi:hypothetical protein